MDLRDKNGKRIRTYRREARKSFTQYSKNCKKNTNNQTRKQIGKQLGYVRRNLENIGKLATADKIFNLSKKHLHDIAVIVKIYEQQKYMYENKTNQCPDRIVSISQDWVRPMKRGKAGSETEFGIKTTFCEIEGMTYVGKQSFDNYNEGTTLKNLIEQFYEKFNFYPEEILADKIYHNRENKKLCKSFGIKFIGKPLGRRPKDAKKQKELAKEEYRAQCDRAEIEGRFGVGKRKFGLNLIKMKKKETTKTMVSLIAMALNK